MYVFRELEFRRVHQVGRTSAWKLVLEGDPGREVTPEVPESTKLQLRRGQVVGKAHKRQRTEGFVPWRKRQGRLECMCSPVCWCLLAMAVSTHYPSQHWWYPRPCLPLQGFMYRLLQRLCWLYPPPPLVSQMKNYRCRETRFAKLTKLS